MNKRIDLLTQTLLGKPRLEEVSLQELKKLVLTYPWMTAARLLVVKKMQEERDPQWKTEWARSAGYFSDMQWASFLLSPPIAVATNPTPSPRAATQPVAPSEKELLFEPYYTVDYFASQGIQFKPDENPNDKFGQQLKSFTDWIKVMKRLPLTDLGKSIDPKEERKVEQMAGNSLTNEEVYTEAMAAVWVKQGNLAKAREIYQKLSLLEPSKSAYFASKISALQ